MAARLDFYMIMQVFGCQAFDGLSLAVTSTRGGEQASWSPHGEIKNYTKTPQQHTLVLDPPPTLH